VKRAQQKVFLIAKPDIDWDEVAMYLREIGGERWLELFDRSADYGTSDAENLVEFAGKMCYRSWAPGLNVNVKKVRDDQEAYLQNILKQRHGSVLEHACFTFVFHNVSRVLTHELIRHRPGVAVSQESLRYVRLNEIPMWIPKWAWDDKRLMDHADELVSHMEDFQEWMAEYFKLDEAPMHEKKAKTSFMRRFAPEGVATGMTWTANVRTLRHVIEARTDPGAEEEIRMLFSQVGTIMRGEAPLLFSDYVVDNGHWVPAYRKV
jgi:thymidylate synthase (FAD)